MYLCSASGEEASDSADASLAVISAVGFSMVLMRNRIDAARMSRDPNMITWKLKNMVVLGSFD
jgi:hypothetical protein